LRRDEVSSVLICRINGRIGNTLFLTAAIRRLHELLPDAAIDLALAFPKAAELLGPLPGVRRVIVFPHKTGGVVWRYLAALRRMRQCRYDLVIDPTIESTSNRMTLSLCRARYRLGFVAPSQWAPLTHGVAEPEDIDRMHEALRPVFLVSRIFQAPYEPDAVRLWLPLEPERLEAGRRRLGEVIGVDPLEPERCAFGFFAQAAAFKLIDPAWWQAFWEAFLALEPRAIPVEFLPSPGYPATVPRFSSLHVPVLRDLAATIAATRMFISTDTGPMHLGSSTAVPTVGLFRASNPTLYRPLKPTDLAIDIGQCSAQEVAARCHRIWRGR
jgi:ADP-heptose:LPS heptosyltransferase